MVKQDIDLHFESFIGYVRKDLSFYEGMVQKARDDLKAAGSDETALNAKRNYGDYAEPFKTMYRYSNEDRLWVWGHETRNSP